MFSGSGAFQGGAPGGRLDSQYGQTSLGSQPPMGTFGGQQVVGYGQGPQSQMTGFPGHHHLTGYPSMTGQQQQYPQQPQLQNQQTGISNQQYTPQTQTQLQPQQASFLGQSQHQHQPSGLNGQAPPPAAAPRQRPQPTGMTSAQMANSFKTSTQSEGPPLPPPNNAGARIPKQRLSFITAEDQAKFEQLFKSAVGNGQALSGDQARDLLLRSKLPGGALGDIWTLADTTKSGQLLFPEFALAMYLCNLALVGKTIPNKLPDRVQNEVSSMVDIISFAAPDDPSQQSRNTSTPNFDPASQAPHKSNTHLLGALQAQSTGFPGQSMGQQQQVFAFAPQPTGYQQLQPIGVMPQQTGFPQVPQASGYDGPRPPLPPMPTGHLQPAAAPLNAQPTGRPGQWGLVNAPASGLPNIDALQQQMMPQPGREGNFTTTGLRGNATVPWAVTKDEKRIYDDLFKAWDGFGKGYITGNQCIEIFGQSGLEKTDLERIWTLADPSNRGRLDLDEFAVAMHLIYRKLNGYPVPARLPPELIPPSTRNLNSSITSMRSMLSKDAEERRNNMDYLQPQKTGVSYLKTHSFAGTNTNNTVGRKDATVFKNNDNDVGYKSSARHRLGGGARSPSPAQTPSPAYELADELSLEQLQKKIREKGVLLDAIDFQDENQASQDEALDRKDRRDAEDMYNRIRRIQEDIDAHPKISFTSNDASAERRNLKRQLQRVQDRLPELASHVRKTEKVIMDTRLELFRLTDAKAHPGGAQAIVGTGHGGAVTESDRLRARAKAMMQQRSAALSGKSPPAEDSDEAAAATQRLEGESSRAKQEKENNDRMVRDVEEGVITYSQSVDNSLKEGVDDQDEHERRRWEDALGVEDEIRDFIFDLQRSSRAARTKREDANHELRRGGPQAMATDSLTLSGRAESPALQEDSARPPPAPLSGGSYSAHKTPEDRAAFIRQQAEQRMADRMAALGLRAPSKSGNNTQDKAAHEQKERAERQRQAEAEDAERDQERQRRLESESITPPALAKIGKKPPPAPPSRKRGDSLPQKRQAEAEQRRATQDIAEKALKEQQEVQEAETRKLQDEAQRQEEELIRQRSEAEERQRALEERVRQGKLKKEEEKARKKAAAREAEETKAREDRLAAQRAEIEAASYREEELQRQLAQLDEDSSDEEGPQQLTPMDDTPIASQELPKPATISPLPAPPMAVTRPSASFISTLDDASTKPLPATSTASPPVTSPPTAVTSPPTESKNPFFKHMASNDTTAAPQSGDTNPFHRMAAQPAPAESSIAAPIAAQATGRRRAMSSDSWSNVSSDEGESDDGGGARPSGAKELASMLFGTMAPPRPLSSQGEKAVDSPRVASPPAVTSPATSPLVPETTPSLAPPPSMPDTAPASAPPLPPSMPMSGAPPPPPMPSLGAPPPPPPMPTAGAPPAPKMPGAFEDDGPTPAAAAGDRGALLGQIQAGKGLKKVQTKDRSQANTAGRVLG